MVYAHKVNRVTLSGTMFGGVEEWSTGFWMGEESADAQVPTQAYADAIRNLWITFFEAATSNISANYLFTQCKVAHINTNGTTDVANTVYSFPGATVDGGTGTGTLPPQCSLVLTLRSDRPRGLASKGRMYLPGLATIIESSGKIGTTVRDNIATNLQTFFDGVRASASIPDTPILAAKGTGAFPELTAQNDYIQTIQVGNVVDTQRRRRNGLAEAYAVRTLV